MRYKCSKCGSTYTDASNWDFHKKAAHFESDHIYNALEGRSAGGGREYEIGTLPSESARAHGFAGQLMNIGQPEEPQIPIAPRVIKYHCQICNNILDIREYPTLLSEQSLQYYHETLESPNCRTQREQQEIATQALADEFKDGKTCPHEGCGRKFFARLKFEEHVASPHKSKQPKTDVVVEKIKSALAFAPDATPTELSERLQIPRTTVNSALERIKRGN